MFEAVSVYMSYVLFVTILIELIVAVYLDLTTAKFPNKLFLIYLGLNFSLFMVLNGPSAFMVSLMTFGVAVLLLFPIYYTKILGGGDVKLILSISPALLMDDFIIFLLMSFVWAGVFGLVRSVLGGNLRALLMNTLFAAKRVTVAEDAIPFTVGILLGWCSYKSALSLGFIS